MKLQLATILCVCLLQSSLLGQYHHWHPPSTPSGASIPAAPDAKPLSHGERTQPMLDYVQHTLDRGSVWSIVSENNSGLGGYFFAADGSSFSAVPLDYWALIPGLHQCWAGCTLDMLGPGTLLVRITPPGESYEYGGADFSSSTADFQFSPDGMHMVLSGLGGGGGGFTECNWIWPTEQCIDTGNIFDVSISGYYVANFYAIDSSGTWFFQDLTLTTEGLATVNPNPLRFNAQVLRTASIAKSVAFINKSNAQMSVSSVSVTGDFAIAHNYCMNGVKPGTLCNVWITFKPTAVGTRTGKLTFVTNAVNSPHTVDLIGTGTQLRLSTQSIVFPLQVVGTTSATKQVNFANIGTTAVSINNITSSGDFALGIAAVNPCPVSGTLAGGANCNIAIAFRPTAANTSKGSLTINDSDPGSPHVVSLSGTGTVVKLSAKTLTFPTTVLGYKSAAKQILMTNVGTTTLSISGIAASGDFAQTNSCGPTLAAGMSCAITVTFAPTGINTRTGSITITDNGGGSPQTVALQGTGTQVQLPATSVNFGKIAKGTTASRLITLTNVGATIVTITGFTTSGTNGADFSSPVNPPCGGSVAAGATCTIALRFSPSIVGTERATFSLFDDGGGSPQKVTLAGIGI